MIKSRRVDAASMLVPGSMNRIRRKSCARWNGSLVERLIARGPAFENNAAGFIQHQDLI
jgi:hypothetical protein